MRRLAGCCILGDHIRIRPKRAAVVGAGAGGIHRDAAIAAITLNSHGLDDFASFERTLAGVRHVAECTKVSGSIGYFVRFICPDIGAYQMLSDELLRLSPKVGNLSSHVVLNTVKPFSGIVLDDLVSAQ